MKLDISARVLKIPRYCACCDGPGEVEISATATRKKGNKTDSQSWAFPYCHACARHIGLNKQAWTCIALGTLAAFGTGVVAGWWGGVVLAIAFAAWGILWDRARDARLPKCACTGGAVKYVTWHGTVHTFEFASTRYGKRMLEANHQKVRAVSS
jgi:hypothetical protein